MLMLAALVCAVFSSARAQIDEALRAIITTSDDVEIIEVTNDEAWPWIVEDGVATSTNGKASGTTESLITFKFRCKGDMVFSYYTLFDPYSSYNYRRVYIDGVREVDTYNSQSAFTNGTLYRTLTEGEHTLSFACYHDRYTSSNYTQQLSVKDVSIKSVESQVMTIDLSEAGTLGVEALGLVNSLPEMRYLRLTGSLNSNDWNTIKNMTGLRALYMENTTVTDIPASAFVNNPLYYFSFPKGLKTIGERAFYDRYLYGHLSFPETLESIGNYAFYRNNITSLTLPASLTTLGTYAFQSNASLTEVTLGGGFATIPSYSFQSCTALKTVNNCSSITSVGSYAFYGCTMLESMKDLRATNYSSQSFYNCQKLNEIDLTTAKTIGSEAFYQCYAITELDLQSCTSLGDYCFRGCLGLTKVRFNDAITTIPYYSFYNCRALEDIILGASVRSLGSNCFYSNPQSIKHLYVNAPAPPTVSTSFYGIGGITLYVPEYAMTSYKLDNYWSGFTSVENNPFPVSQIELYNKLELTSNVRIPGAPAITLGWANNIPGMLTINGNNPQELGKYVQYLNQQYTYCPSVISRCNSVTSTSSELRLYCGNALTYWYYLSMPYDVNVADITCTDGAVVAIRYYDSESRANNGSGGNWKNVSADGVLKEGQTYIFCVNKACYVYLPGTDDTHNNIFKSNAVTTALQEYPTEVSNDANWNLVGNPYPAYYDIYYMDYTAPITVWSTSNKTFTAYSVADDELVLYPLQGFFVQKPTLVDGITFQTAGRQLTSVIDHSATVKGQGIVSRARRQIIDLSLGDGVGEDKTRVVVNPDASDAFCADNDASKMLAYEGTPQLYTLRGQDIYAINEGCQQEGSVQLGMYLPAEGTYTLTLSRHDVDVQLYDNGEAVEIPYTFSAGEGSVEDRFVLAIASQPDAIQVVGQGQAADRQIYTIGGLRVSDTVQKGVYIRNNKKVVK